jgi:uncharacterized protein involved in exopolysaccharide biosynthesis
VNPELVRPINGSPPVPYYVDQNPQQDGGINAKLILYSLFKRKWQVLGIVAVVVLSILVTGLLRPLVYKTSAKLFVRPARAEIQMGAGAQRELTFPVSASSEMMNSEMEILRSQELMRQVIERMEKAGTPIFGSDTTMSVPEQVAALQGMMIVGPTPESNVIGIDLFVRNREKGQAILGAIVDTFLERHARIHGSSGATQFFEDQKNITHTRMTEAEKKLGDFVEREQLIMPEDQIRAALKGASRGSESIAISQAKVHGLERRVAKLKEQLATAPTLQRDLEKVNPTATGIAVELSKKEAERADLLQHYMENDRLVVDVNAQIATLAARLAESKEASVVGTERISVNPIRQELERRLLQSELNLADMSARVDGLEDKLDQQADDATKEAVGLRQKSIELSSLEQEVSLAREAYQLYERKQEESRISEALDQERFLNVSVIDGPTMPLEPVNKMNPLMLVAALIAGTGLGVGTAVGLEFLGRNFKFEEQVEQYLELPVFAVIPDMSEVAELQHS